MFRLLRTLIFCISLLGLIVSNTGCFALLVGGAAGAGAVAWVQGELAQNFDESLNSSYNATIKGLKKLDLPIISENKDKFKGTVKSEYSDGKGVTVVIEALTERSSSVKVRVGTFGDKSRSESIMSAIQRYL